MRIATLLTLASAVLLAAQLSGQSQPTYYRTTACIKVAPGKTAEYQQFTSGATRMMMQARANAGEIVSWALLRYVIPAGDEARCDYVSSTTYPGVPAGLADNSTLGKALEKGGVKMTAAEYLAKRASLTRLVALDMWRPRVIVGEARKGNYLFLNHMKVHSPAEYFKFETEIWRPMAEQWVKEGSQTGWQFSTLAAPSGTDVKYTATSTDIYPTLEAALKPRSLEEAFKKAYPDKDYQQTVGGMGKLRDLAQRDLLFVEQRVTGK